jgi:hypothetical protein
MIPNKVCRNCSIEKEAKDYYKTKSKSYPDSMLNWCKICVADYRKERRVLATKPSFKVEVTEITFSFD